MRSNICIAFLAVILFAAKYTSAQTRILKRETNMLAALDFNDSKRFFREIFDAIPFTGKTGVFKTFKTQDNRAQLLCFFNNNFEYEGYACSIVIDVETPGTATSVTVTQSEINALITQPEEANALFEGLALPTTNTNGVEVKSFQTSDLLGQIQCSRGKETTISTECTFSISSKITH